MTTTIGGKKVPANILNTVRTNRINQLAKTFFLLGGTDIQVFCQMDKNDIAKARKLANAMIEKKSAANVH